MDKLNRMKMRDMKNADIFALYTEYIRHSITEDLRTIYEDEVELVDAKEPWIFKLGKK